MRLDKCDACTAKKTLGCREKSYLAAARGAAKREENQRGTRETNNQSSPIRRREEFRED